VCEGWAEQRITNTLTSVQQLCSVSPVAMLAKCISSPMTGQLFSRWGTSRRH